MVTHGHAWPSDFCPITPVIEKKKKKDTGKRKRPAEDEEEEGAPTKKKTKAATSTGVPSAPFARSRTYKSRPTIESEDEDGPPVAGPSGTRHETPASRGTGGEDGDAGAPPLSEAAVQAIACRRKIMEDAAAAKKRMEANIGGDSRNKKPKVKAQAKSAREIAVENSDEYTNGDDSDSN